MINIELKLSFWVVFTFHQFSSVYEIDQILKILVRNILQATPNKCKRNFLQNINWGLV